ncbi:MAG: MFS transporter [Proteobacteria bacterium]|nr:MFS transporter [Pseudomonadota bacterium]
MNSSELKNTLILALVFASRMLGLFMVLPVLALYAAKIPGATPFLIGVAAGIYGLTQALFQLPCGVLSDYFGRRSIIVLGLGVFLIGSLIAAFSSSIWGLVIGRAIQGMGAVGSPILALVADLTREQVRSRAMAIIGISIGFTFVLAFLVGPILDAKIGLSGIFLLTAFLSTIGILLLFLLGTIPKQSPLKLKDQFSVLFKDQQLWHLNANIFILHAILTACFLVFPAHIETVTGLTSQEVWRFYLPVLAVSVLLVAPLLRFADEVKWQKMLMKTALIGLGISCVMFIYSTQAIPLYIFASLFFLAFNFLEASLPAMVSRMVPKTSKGSALGVYSFSQFLGMFAGGIFGGCMLQWNGPWGIGFSCLLLTMLGCILLAKEKGQEKWQEELIK